MLLAAPLYRRRSRGVVLLTCLIILSLLAVITISGADRALVNLKLTNNLQLNEHSFILAEAALQLALTKITQDPGLLQTTASLLIEDSERNEIYKVFSIYKGSGDTCNKTPGSISQHYELIAMASVGRYANARHALGVSVCEYTITEAIDGSKTIVALSRPAKSYWRTVNKAEADLLLPQSKV
jgi:hypothetical protein